MERTQRLYRGIDHRIAWCSTRRHQLKPRGRDRTPATTATDPRGESSDQVFVVTAAMAGMAEMEHGKLATGKAANLKVKDFGERMIAATRWPATN